MDHGEPIGVLGEEALVERLARALGAARPPVQVGIGDDCAVLRVADRSLLFATDTMVEGTHFTSDPGHPLTDMTAAGWRLGASNLSDLAAMGGRPLAGVVSVALPPEWPVEWVDLLYGGLTAVCDRYDLPICGGDVVRIEGPATFTLAVLGEAIGDPLLRSGGHPRDQLAVTGTLGESAMCLRMVNEGLRPPEALLQRHLRPEPRLEWGQALAGCASAMMDLSDGLATDLPRLARASGVGAVIRESALPIHSRLLSATGDPAAARRQALVGGEDYELLVALPRGAKVPDIPLTIIGELTAEAGQVDLIGADGGRTPLAQVPGWRHFEGPG